jgi:hypothetical protein
MQTLEVLFPRVEVFPLMKPFWTCPGLIRRHRWKITAGEFAGLWAGM